MVQINSEFSSQGKGTAPTPATHGVRKIKLFLGKYLLTIILACALLFVGSSLVLVVRGHALQQQLKTSKGDILTLSKESSQFKSAFEKAQKELAKVTGELDVASADRDRLNVQVKNLLAEKDKAREMEASLEKLKLDKEVAEKDRELLLKEGQDQATQLDVLRNARNDLEAIKQQLIKEKEQLQETLDLERRKSGIKKFEDEKTAAKKESATLAKDLKDAQSQIKALKANEEKLQDQIKQLSEKSDSLSEAYTQAAKSNKAYEGGALDTPAKVTELARQNKVLIRQTARMHYNLGVFYSKHKEYSNAISEFKRAVELTPDDAYSYFNIGYIYAEQIVNRPKAIAYFRMYLQHARKDDKDADWVKKYILTWETWQGKQPMQ